MLVRYSVPQPATGTRRLRRGTPPVRRCSAQRSELHSEPCAPAAPPIVLQRRFADKRGGFPSSSRLGNLRANPDCHRLNEMVEFLSSGSRLGCVRTTFGSAPGLTKRGFLQPLPPAGLRYRPGSPPYRRKHPPYRIMHLRYLPPNPRLPPEVLPPRDPPPEPPTEPPREPAEPELKPLPPREGVLL